MTRHLALALGGTLAVLLTLGAGTAQAQQDTSRAGKAARAHPPARRDTLKTMHPRDTLGYHPMGSDTLHRRMHRDSSWTDSLGIRHDSSWTSPGVMPADTVRMPGTTIPPTPAPTPGTTTPNTPAPGTPPPAPAPGTTTPAAPPRTP